VLDNGGHVMLGCYVAMRRLVRRIADAVIHNDGLSLDALRGEVEALWNAWTADHKPRNP
jgi:hypothetical protein